MENPNERVSRGPPSPPAARNAGGGTSPLSPSAYTPDSGEGESASSVPSTPDGGEDRIPPTLGGREKRNLEWMSEPPVATAGRTRCETRAALQPLGRTRAGTRVTSNVLMTIAEAKFEIQEMTMAMGPGTAREKAMILEEEYEEAMAYAYTADPNPGKPEFCPPPIGVHIGDV